jgi:hypothetical protein
MRSDAYMRFVDPRVRASPNSSGPFMRVDPRRRRSDVLGADQPADLPLDPRVNRVVVAVRALWVAPRGYKQAW